MLKKLKFSSIGVNIMKKKLTLKVEQLEERIAPSFVLDPGIGSADPVGGQGGLTASFGPNSGLTPNLHPWIAHNTPSPLDNGGNA